MDSKKYIGMDVHKESISIAVMNGAGKIVMECVIETKASMILRFIDGLRGDVQVTFEEGTSHSRKNLAGHCCKSAARCRSVIAPSRGPRNPTQGLGLESLNGSNRSHDK
jgi:hypothetical protein